ncbi:MAG: hypothetical protein GXP24_09615 [Planctomycetes bacterium]|nr:hypothetical protein [Planctomycetota bacterium]
MSQPSLESASVVPSIINKKPVLDVYTVMLIVALVSLLMGCLFLYLEIKEYGGFGAIKGPVAMIGNSIRTALLC